MEEMSDHELLLEHSRAEEDLKEIEKQIDERRAAEEAEDAELGFFGRLKGATDRRIGRMEVNVSLLKDKNGAQERILHAKAELARRGLLKW